MTFDGAEAAYISDFRSTHGTFVTRAASREEKRLEEKDMVQLHSGDVVRFGESSRRYVFHIAEEKQEKKKPAAAPDAGVVDLGDGRIKVTLQAPSRIVERLTSKEGAKTLKDIEQRTNTRLAFDRDLGDRRPMRLVEIRGLPNSVAAARLELLTLSSNNNANPVFDSSHHRFRYASTALPSESLFE